MNGELEALVRLAGYGSAVLADGEHDAPPPWQATAFRFVRKVEFDFGQKTVRLRNARFERDADGWLRRLRKAGARRIWLDIHSVGEQAALDARIESSFAGSQQWGLLVTYDKRAERWFQFWSPSPNDAEGDRVWDVKYLRVEAPSAAPLRESLTAARAELERLLVRTRDFAGRQSLDGWREWFEAALDPGRAPYEPEGEAMPLLPVGFFSDEACDLIAFASQSWVFGGMGSWNDLMFDGEVERSYQQISNDLYDAVLSAIVASVNSPAQGGSDRAQG